MKRNLLYILGVVCLMTSCVEENLGNHDISPAFGKEVNFSADLNSGLSTRTNYGSPVLTDGDTTAFKVNWADNDQILAYCIESNTQSAYDVIPMVDVNGENLNYAESLEKTQTNGVQWGSGEKSTFVAVYPASSSSIDKDGVVTAQISASQNCVFEEVKGADDRVIGWKGTSFDDDATKTTMPNGFMFARTEAKPEVVVEGQTTTTNEVNLRFKPYSTVLKFEFVGYEANISTVSTIYVQKITVTAPVAVAGKFSMSLSGSGIGATAVLKGDPTEVSNVITLNTILPSGGYIPLKPNQSLEFDVFVMPTAAHALNEQWSVKLTTDKGDFTYKLVPKTNQTPVLVLGQINKIKVPKFEITTPVELDPTKWISEMTQSVYLSELSVPGAWYCMDSGYQGSIGLESDELTYTSQKTTDGTVTSWYTTSKVANGIDDGLENLFYNGVRAFNIDCRISRDEYSAVSIGNPWKETSYTNGEYHFACSGTEEPGSYSIFGIGYNKMVEGTHVLDAVQDIITLAQKHPKEYVVIIFTFAEKPCTEGDLGSTLLYGTVDPVLISQEINTVLTNENVSKYLYTGITPDTTIDDVITSGKNVIVKINHSNINFMNDDSTKGPVFTMMDGIMASFASMAMEGYNATDDYISDLADDYYSKMQKSLIYNGKSANDMTYYFHQAQKTEESPDVTGTTYPSVYDRLLAIDEILENATIIYDNSHHNALFQLGIGGSVNDSPSTLASTINLLVKEKIDYKLANNPSPVGFVLMNNALNADYGLPLVKSIMEMNTKFYLKRKGENISTGSVDNQGGTEDGPGDEV